MLLVHMCLSGNAIFIFIHVLICYTQQLMDFDEIFKYYEIDTTLCYFPILKRPVHIVSLERRTRKAPSPARRSLGIKDQGSWMRCTRISLSYILANQPPSTPTIRPFRLVLAPFSSLRDFCRIACPASA